MMMMMIIRVLHCQQKAANNIFLKSFFVIFQVLKEMKPWLFQFFFFLGKTDFSLATISLS